MPMAVHFFFFYYRFSTTPAPGKQPLHTQIHNLWRGYTKAQLQSLHLLTRVQYKPLKDQILAIWQAEAYLHCSSWSSRDTLKLLLFGSFLCLQHNLFMSFFKELAFSTLLQICYFFKFNPVLRKVFILTQTSRSIIFNKCYFVKTEIFPTCSISSVFFLTMQHFKNSFTKKISILQIPFTVE